MWASSPATELRTYVSRRNRTSDCVAAQWPGDEATALFTTGIGDTIRERAIAETPARTGREVVFIDEVTAIFTTDRELVGGEQATLLPLRRAMTELPAHGTPGGS